MHSYRLSDVVFGVIFTGDVDLKLLALESPQIRIDILAILVFFMVCGLECKGKSPEEIGELLV